MRSQPGRTLPTFCSTLTVPPWLYSAWTLWYLGFPDSALQKVEAGLAIAQRLGHASSVASALIFAAALHNLRREFDLAHRRAETAVGIGPAAKVLLGRCRAR
jgi:hypothetical protein